MNTKSKIKTLLIFALVLLLSSNSNIAQNVGIGTESFTPHESAMLEVKSTTKGLLPPRMTTTERDLIQNPAEGLQIFNTTTKCLEVFVYGIWQQIFCAICPVPNAPLAGTHVPSETEIVWNWNSSAGADGYKWHTTNNYAAATDLGNNTTVIQTGLTCNTPYTIYVWAYNACGTSDVLVLNESTGNCPWACSDTFTDIRDNNVYTTVQIGDQCWMAMNLNYSTANSWCYNNNSSNCSTYGRLYTWDAAMSGSPSSEGNPSGVQGACPAGWHLPSDSEWTQLTSYLGGEGWAGGKMKTVSGWNSPNEGATNETGFSALPAGMRCFQTDQFGCTSATASKSMYQLAQWWSTTETSVTSAWRRGAGWSYAFLGRHSEDKRWGFSVRCIKD